MKKVFVISGSLKRHRDSMAKNVQRHPIEKGVIKVKEFLFFAALDLC